MKKMQKNQPVLELEKSVSEIEKKEKYFSMHPIGLMAYQNM